MQSPREIPMAFIVKVISLLATAFLYGRFLRFLLLAF